MIGDYIGTMEEFMPGEGTYVADGKIYAANIGKLVLDKKNHTARIDGKIPVELKVGQTVFGYVMAVRPTIVSVIVTKIKGFKRDIDVRTGIHVSQISNGYIEKPEDAFGIGDIVRGRITKMEPDLVDLTTKEGNLGVVKAFCKKCRHTLVKIEKNIETEGGRKPKNNLECTFCKNKEYRKITQDYGVITEI